MRRVIIKMSRNPEIKPICFTSLASFFTAMPQYESQRQKIEYAICRKKTSFETADFILVRAKVL